MHIRWLLLVLLLTAACTDPAAQFVAQPTQVTLTADGETRQLSTEATNVRALLEEAGVTLGETDEVTPPPFTPLTDGLEIQVVRVTESIEFIERAIPFERKVVRNESMGEDDPPLIIQGGQTGLEELTVRIVYRDGIEVERRVTQATVVGESQDEIVMIGLGVAVPDNVTFGGTLAYISGGNSLILRGATAFPDQLNTGGDLDRRVFRLSPTGSHLLYTRIPTNTADSELFNALWLISTERGAEPTPLGIDNVLWAEWNPAKADALEIAYTTGSATDLPPGWEANNDLWLGEITFDEAEEEGTIDFEPEQLIESYPATYGWWGGNFAWGPNGRYIAYSYADEVGIIDLEADFVREPETVRRQLQRFTEFNTRADWVWVPTLTWSPDGRYLAFTQHGGESTDAEIFDLWAVDVASGVSGRFVDQAGIWGYPSWSTGETLNQQIAYLRSSNPSDSLRSSYTLWLMDSDGSNGRQIYPLPGEISHFSREEQFMAWSGAGEDVAFIYNDDLYLHNLESGETYQVTQTDAVVSHPTWAPYGAAVTPALPTTQVEELEIPEVPLEDLIPEQ